MADQKVSAMSDSGVPDDADLLYLVDVSSPDPKQRKCTVSNLRAAVDTTVTYHVKNLTIITNDGASHELFIDGVAERLSIPDDSAFAFEALIVARRTDANNESAGYRIEGVIDRNAGTVALVGIPSVWTLGEDSAAWSVSAVADDVNKALTFQVTGEVGKTIKWAGVARIAKVTG